MECLVTAMVFESYVGQVAANDYQYEASSNQSRKVYEKDLSIYLLPQFC